MFSLDRMVNGDEGYPAKERAKMIIDWSAAADYTLITAGLALCAIMGAFCRASFALFRVYQSKGYFSPDWRYVVSYVACSAFFGGIATAVLTEFGVVGLGARFGAAGLAFVGGILGPGLMDKIPKEFGVDPDFVQAMDRVPSALSPRQLKAIEFIKSVGCITNKGYSQLNSVSGSTATSDLCDMVKKGFLKELGRTKGVRYVL